MNPFATFDAPTSAIAVLTAMITPAVLISACGTLVLSTSNRLARLLDRMRHLPAEVEELERRREAVPHYDERRAILFGQMKDIATRGRLLQISLTLLYLGIAIFVSTSVAIGLVSGGWSGMVWLPVATAMPARPCCLARACC